MLSHHLQGALVDLRDLIKITESDIADIKEAKNDPQFDRLSLKEEKLKSFEQKKAMIDHEISSLMTKNPDMDLPQLLSKEQHLQLDDLKKELNNLRDVNKHYARLVLVVSNLYNTFLERVVPTEMRGYNKVASKSPSILEVRV
jgi:cystathionine beta-lyase family protein involved in aluminum resistance